MIKKNESISYEKILFEWLEAKQVQVKETTYARYWYLVNKYILPVLGKYQISQITTKVLEDFIRQQLLSGKLKGGGGLSPKTVSDIFSVVKNSIEYAKYHDYKVECNLNGLYIKKKRKEMRVLSVEEQSLLIKVLVKDMDIYKFGVLLCLYTGLRIGELCALKWGDFSNDNHVLKVDKTIQRISNTGMHQTDKTHIVIGEPKSQSSIREIPLPECMGSLLQQFRQEPEAFVLEGKKYQYVEPRTMQNRFQVYVKQSGIRPANFHALRHTFATRCVEVGFEIKSLSEILGHANVNITLNKYVHSSFELKSNNMNKLSLIA